MRRSKTAREKERQWHYWRGLEKSYNYDLEKVQNRSEMHPLTSPRHRPLSSTPFFSASLTTPRYPVASSSFSFPSLLSPCSSVYFPSFIFSPLLILLTPSYFLVQGLIALSRLSGWSRVCANFTVLLWEAPPTFPQRVLHFFQRSFILLFSRLSSFIFSQKNYFEVLCNIISRFTCFQK